MNTGRDANPMTTDYSSPPDAPDFRFATKATTLERLAPYLTQARLCDQIIVSAATATVPAAEMTVSVAKQSMNRSLRQPKQSNLLFRRPNIFLNVQKLLDVQNFLGGCYDDGINRLSLFQSRSRRSYRVG